MKAEAHNFKNSDACEGVVYTAEYAPLDIATLSITGRYPEGGWAMNEVSHEMVFVQRGLGWLALRDQGKLINLKEGDGVYVPAGERFAWGGDMAIVMACYPPFSPDQYSVETYDTEHIKLHMVALEYLDIEDIEFMMTELDEYEDQLGYVYGKLIEEGEDPDEILQEAEII